MQVMRLRVVGEQTYVDCFVDDEDYETLSRHSWLAQRGGNTMYAVRCTDIARRKVSIRMHRQILKPVAGQWIDHKDRNGLNNTRENLRFATPSENRVNSPKGAPGVSRYKGVIYDPTPGRPGQNRNKVWRAMVIKDGKRYRAGRFRTEEEAALAYNKKALELYGEYVLPNKI